ncbi:hypothetical protein, partial [Streptomyces adelaidensis]|uniref:hypothetical protein n=1 Tax=Streptomyces adelaidensis TaxID=2796465 RepID=UPI0027DDF734
MGLGVPRGLSAPLGLGGSLRPRLRPGCGQSCRWGGTGGRGGTPQARVSVTALRLSNSLRLSLGGLVIRNGLVLGARVGLRLRITVRATRTGCGPAALRARALARSPVGHRLAGHRLPGL